MFKRSLMLRIVAIVIIGFLMLFSYFSLASLQGVKTSFAASEKEKAQTIAKTLIPTVAINFGLNLTGALNGPIEELLRQNSAILAIRILPKSTATIPMLFVQEGVEESIFDYGQDYIYHAENINDYFNKSRSIATLEIAYTNQRYKGLVASYIETLSILFIGFVILLIGVVWVLYRAFRPLTGFAQTIRNVDFADPNYRIQVPAGEDEVGQLGRAIALLLSRQKSHTRELKAFNDTLQERVEEKTRELKEINESLQERVALAVNEMRQKDDMMLKQSRHAALGEMIGNIAHQWRQPINTLSILLYGIKDEYDHDELDKAQMERHYQKGLDVIQRMSQTIDDFRNFFKPDKKRVAFSVGDIYHTALGIVGVSLERANIKLHEQIQTNEPIHGYPNEFAQVIINILNNAKDAFEDNKETKERQIIIRAYHSDEQLHVEIADNAGGIDSAVLERIFDPYFSTKAEGKGTGIGLYMSKMIIERSMNGRLDAYNEADGAVFITPRRWSVSRRKLPLKLLYVEDDVPTAEAISFILQNYFERFEMAQNGAIGLEKFKSFSPDIVVSDISMPVMDGFTMIEEIRRIEPEATIILTTAHNEDKVFTRSVELGIDGFIIKPVNPDKLLTTVEKVSRAIIRKRELERQREEMFNNALIASKADMLSDIAHHWRQPLNGLGLILQTIQDQFESDELEKEILERFIDEGFEAIGGLSRIIDTFISSLRHEGDETLFLACEKLEDALFLLKDQLDTHQVISRLPSDIEIYGYQETFTQLMLYLIKNSLEAYERSGNEGDIEITVRREDKEFVFEVIDSGGGVEEGELERIFEPYITTKKDLNGRGMGLTLSRYIVENDFGGSIVALRNDKGLTILIRIPEQPKESIPQDR